MTLTESTKSTLKYSFQVHGMKVFRGQCQERQNFTLDTLSATSSGKLWTMATTHSYDSTNIICPWKDVSLSPSNTKNPKHLPSLKGLQHYFHLLMALLRVDEWDTESFSVLKSKRGNVIGAKFYVGVLQLWKQFSSSPP